MRFFISFVFISFFVTINSVAFGDFEVGTISDAELVGARMRAGWKPLESLPKDFLNNTGIRQLNGKHITLYSDIKSGADVDRFPQIFDQMVLELCIYFGLDLNKYGKFHVRAFLIDDLEKFRKFGVLKDAADLRYGYSLRNRIWVRRQDSDYYQRHLFLHEGVHAFMFYAFGTFPPFWYREGIAEMLATHKFENGKLKLGWFPVDSVSVFRLGRVEIIQRLVSGGVKAKAGVVDVSDLSYLFSLGKNIQSGNQIELYALSWGFVMFCENHPRYRNAFRKIVFRLKESDAEFIGRFIRLIARDNKTDILTAQFRLAADWNDFKKNICYGYDFDRAGIDFGLQSIIVTKNNTDNVLQEVIIRADRGWQNSGVKLEAGKGYKLTAEGRFQLADKPAIWWSEPNGITIKYNQKMPIGKLIAMIVPEPVNSAMNISITNNRNFPPPEYKEIGSDASWQPSKTGLLFLKINDSAANLNDNKGTVKIRINAESFEQDINKK
ncbi:MAG: DUF1570 domain-containing protein [Planctomycetaceae bacterium]|nr:DUF1570 domain-containing protein [Planctomycetaceae bacterium]